MAELTEARLMAEKEHSDRKVVAERLFEVEMNYDMVKEQHDSLVKRLEEEMNANQDLKNAIQAKDQHTPSRSQDIVSAVSGYLDDSDHKASIEEPDLTERLQKLTLDNENLKGKTEELSKQLVNALSLTSTNPDEISKIKAENQALRQSLDELNRQLMDSFMTATHVSTPSGQNQGHQSAATGQLKHELEMARLENAGLRDELERLQTNISHLADHKPKPQPGQKYSPVAFKMLEDTLKLLEDENLRLKSEKAKITIDAERLKQAEERSTSAREEASNLKTRVFYLEDQIRSLHSQQVEKDRMHDAIIQKLREEIRASGTPSKLGIISPQLGPSSSLKSHTLSKESPGISPDFEREKRLIEAKLAQAEKDLRAKDQQITLLKERNDSLAKEIEQYRKETPTAKKPSSASLAIEREVEQLRARVALLEEREKEMLDSEAAKEKKIRTLEDQIVKLEGDDSLKLE